MAVTITKPVDLCGGYWSRHYPSPVPGTWASAVAAAAAWPYRKHGTTDDCDFTAGANASSPVLVRGLDFVSSGEVLGRYPETPSGTAVWSYTTPLAVEAAKQEGSYLYLVDAVVRYTGSPAFKYDGVVRYVQDTWRGICVATDYESVCINDGETTALVVGSEVRAGDPVGSAWSLVRLGPVGVTGDRVVVPPGVLEGVTTDPLVFYNSVVTTTKDTSLGYTRVRFPIGGSTVDVQAFWTASEARAVQTGYGMANLLDTRLSPFGPPSAFDVAAAVNPALLVCEKLVCGQGYQLTVDSSQFGEDADPSALDDYTAGPHSSVFVFDGGLPSTAPYLYPF